MTLHTTSPSYLDLVKYKSLFSKFHGRLVVRKWNNTDLTHKYIIKYFMTTRSQSRFVVDIPVAETERFLKLVGTPFYSVVFHDNLKLSHTK